MILVISFSLEFTLFVVTHLAPIYWIIYFFFVLIAYSVIINRYVLPRITFKDREALWPLYFYRSFPSRVKHVVLPMEQLHEENKAKTIYQVSQTEYWFESQLSESVYNTYTKALIFLVSTSIQNSTFCSEHSCEFWGVYNQQWELAC